MKYFIACLFVCSSFWGKSQDSVIVFHKKTPLPSIARIESGYFIIDSSFYVIGGGDSNGNFYKDVWKYNLNSDTWQQMNEFSGSRGFGWSSFVINGIAYLCFGSDSIQYTSQFWEYHPAQDSWVRKNDIPAIPRAVASSFTYSGKAFVGFGTGAPGNDLWRYDPISDQWAKMDSFPSDARRGNPVVVIDSFAYFIGGYYIFISGESNEVWRYHILNNSWELATNIPAHGRGYSSSWSFGRTIISSMGAFGDSVGIDMFSDKYLYNTQTDQWKSLLFQNFVDKTAEGICFSVDNTGWFYGGINQSYPSYTYYNDLYSFDATPLLTTGVDDIKAGDKLSVHPNPASAQGVLTIASSESGEVSFCNTIGQLLYTSRLDAGTNHIPCESLHSAAGVVCYRATLRDGRTENGKVIIY